MVIGDVVIDEVRTRTAYDVAADVPDPELPQLTLADLGILRSVEESDGRVVATITPTYSGCPAMREIGHDVRHRLEQAGYREVEVRTQLAPAWSSDWITAAGRRKLQAAGIAPPSTSGCCWASAAAAGTPASAAAATAA